MEIVFCLFFEADEKLSVGQFTDNVASTCEGTFVFEKSRQLWRTKRSEVVMQLRETQK